MRCWRAAWQFREASAPGHEPGALVVSSYSILSPSIRKYFVLNDFRAAALRS
ncbi:hypothetical protein BZL30_9230 [Mycobacterium kansasii]|uniref:Uncharacterized protein n=1 Tax=Mycobacterium kansasii TaxID=1768 RepID=A0A1V3XE51_MYCKA|nr:hypothetical protein BZL30_9230 [Mycobacterium kansasii]OOK77370.1 hypothetical protein BZL29_3524 [Mycobacterium kansasii]